MSDQNQGGMLVIDGQSFSIADLANATMDGVKPVRGFEKLPAGSMRFDVEDAELGAIDRDKGGGDNTKVVLPSVKYKLKVVDVHALTDKSIDMGEVIGKTHQHKYDGFADDKGNFTQQKAQDWMGRILAFTTDVTGQDIPANTSIQDCLQMVKGKQFDGFITHTTSRNNKDISYANLDVTKIKAVTSA